MPYIECDNCGGSGRLDCPECEGTCEGPWCEDCEIEHCDNCTDGTEICPACDGCGDIYVDEDEED